jgi:hypothetical protein
VLSRRDLLRLAGITAGAGALAACTSSGGGGQSPSPGAPVDPDAALRSEVAAQETALLALYAVSATVLPAAQAARAADLGRRHGDYRAAVLPSASASATPSGSSPSGSASQTAPASARAALRSLQRAEAQASAQRVVQTGRARSSELARTLALVAAGAAGAAEVLRGWTP